jgi:flagellin
VGGRLSLSAVDAGDILINDQKFEKIVVGDDLEDVITNINTNVDNVTASGFNVVVAKQIGTGVTSDGQFDISVQALGASVATTYSISASENMSELVANINAEAGAVVQASVNDEGKLVLSNTTGATITVTDSSATINTYDGGSGFARTSVSFSGFLKLDSKDGNPVRIDMGEKGTINDLESLGFRPTTSDVGSANDAYTVTGKALTTPTAEWGASDLKINGVAIYSSEIDTKSFEGKLNAINNFSADTGVIASAYIDQSFTMTDAQVAGVSSGVTLSFNGTVVYTGSGAGSVSDVINAINAQTSNTGISAEETQEGFRLTGSNVQSLNVAGTTAVAALTSFTSGTSYASIRLDSATNSPISIELGDTHAVAEHGFLEANVGAADFQVNGATMGTGAGNNLSGLSIATANSATAALGTIDKAMGTVSDMRSKLGAMQNRLNSTVDNLSNVVTNTEAARSRIQDTDYATETTALAKSQIIQQAATAMLAQANQQPQSVLSLLQ